MKFKVRVNYVVVGHLRYGHRDVEIEADTEEEALKIVNELDEDELCFDYDASGIKVDDYEINDYYKIGVEVK